MKYDFARLLCIMLSILLTLSIFQMFSPKIASAASANVVNGIQFKDTDGNVVHAHGGGMIKVDGYYYWFGENRNPNGTFKAVSAYRSSDLKNWEFRKNVLTSSSAEELNVSNIERPKVIYNEKHANTYYGCIRRMGLITTRHAWLSLLPIPWTAITRIRAASVLWTTIRAI